MPITLDQLTKHYPSVYHMAERDALAQIARHGLLSTTAILDLFGTEDEDRRPLESRIRKASCTVEHPVHGTITLRDQKPLSETKLASCLQDGLTPEDWLRLLNRKVYFWVSRDKVEELLGAREYKSREHIVLQISTRALVNAHYERVTLAAMNTGTTNPIAHPRGLATMLPLADFPYEDRRRRGLRTAVELCVDYSVPDMMAHVEIVYVGSEETGLVAKNDPR
jgi:hypothetical protein